MDELSQTPSINNVNLDQYDYFAGQFRSLLLGVQSFTFVLKELHSRYDKGEFLDWPTVLLSTILQTTSVSLLKLLPFDASSDGAVDRRSIATLIRNVIDTHDVLDMLCNPIDENEFQLHRDIMGYYLSGRIHTVQNHMDRANDTKVYKKIQVNYWRQIASSSLSKERLGGIKSGENLFYTTRSERVEKICPEHSDFLKGVIADLSTYVHSVPPALWSDTLAHGFDNIRENRVRISLWIQVANFFLAKSAEIVIRTTGIGSNETLTGYIKRHEKLFPPPS